MNVPLAYVSVPKMCAHICGSFLNPLLNVAEREKSYIMVGATGTFLGFGQ